MAQPTDLAFVDLETTGMSPRRDRIIEIAVIRLRWPPDGIGPPTVARFSSLVDPQTAIDPGIRFLTGITPERLIGAPRFADIAQTVAGWLDGALFVAHQARFDHGFLKAEFERCGQAFAPDVLCTVRLSRALDPTREGHGLDALIARHQLGPVQRHTALGDAEVLLRLWQRLIMLHGEDAVREQMRRLLAKPSLPAHLGIGSIQALPARPGVYMFVGLAGQPLYIGKSINLRERVPSHFSADHRTERGLRLASETRALRWQTCAGEFGALLAEADAIRRLMPAQNRASRRVAEPSVLVADADGLAASPRPWRALDPSIEDWAGPFPSRQRARAWLMEQARARQMCMATLGLEAVAVGQACFAHQLGRCPGTCTGRQAAGAHARNLRALLAQARPPRWPAGIALLLHEHDPLHDARAWHLIANWRWLGSAHTAAALAPLISRLHEQAWAGNRPDGVSWTPDAGDDALLPGPCGSLEPDIRIHRLIVQWLSPVIGQLDLGEGPTPIDAARACDDDHDGWCLLQRRARRDRSRYAVMALSTGH
ncbi:MAG: exonuclease domain-containing protein [Burkholderiaceae bacterium]